MSGDQLAGRRAVVTGGATGIGRGIADALLGAGAEVIALDRCWSPDIRASFKGIAESVDIGEVDMSAYGRRILAEHGPVDLIVNNVGITTPHRFLDLDEGHFDRVMAVNLRGPWFLTRELVMPLHQNKRRGSVLFISSVHDTRVRLYPHYAASKAAIVATVRELAHELAPLIRVNAISPGWIDTSNADRESPPQHDLFERLVPLGRSGRPMDIAPTALHLLDDAASPYTTGVSIPVDGGLLLHTWMDDLSRAHVLAPPSAAPTDVTTARGASEVPSVRRLLLEIPGIVKRLQKERATDAPPLQVEEVVAELDRRSDLKKIELLGYPEPAWLVREGLLGSDYSVQNDQAIVTTNEPRGS